MSSRTVDVTTGEETVAHHQRSDVCAVPAAGVVAEAMVAHLDPALDHHHLSRLVDHFESTRHWKAEAQIRMIERVAFDEALSRIFADDQIFDRVHVARIGLLGLTGDADGRIQQFLQEAKRNTDVAQELWVANAAGATSKSGRRLSSRRSTNTR